jgi:[ribosomal protein S5]-alanine N-acetyltransferase
MDARASRATGARLFIFSSYKETIHEITRTYSTDVDPLSNANMIWESLPTIESGRLRLRWVTSKDIDALYRIFSHPEVMRYWSTTPLENRDAAVRLLNDIQEGFRRQSTLKWGIARKEDDEIIGTATLFNLNLDSRRCELGYGLDRAEWGKGYMQEALRTLLAYAFNDLGLHRIEADVDPRNTNSIRTVEKLGFQQEGYLRERWQVGGEIQDALFFGLLRPEWDRRQNDPLTHTKQH